MLKVYINMPEEGRSSEDIEKSYSIVKELCYSLLGRNIEFIIPIIEDREYIRSLYSVMKLIDNSDYYVRLDSGKTYDHLYLSLEAISRIYKNDFDVIDLTNLREHIMPDLY